MSKDFKLLISKLKDYSEELTPTLVVVLLESQKFKPLKIELQKYLEKNKILKHSNYLEIVALAHGFKDYNHLSAYLNNHGTDSISELYDRHQSINNRLSRNFHNNGGDYSDFYIALSKRDFVQIKKELTEEIIYNKKGIHLAHALDYLSLLGDPYIEPFLFFLDHFKKASSKRKELKHNYKTICSNIMSSLKFNYQCEIAKALLSEMVFDIDVQSEAIINAIDNNSNELCQILLQHGFNPNYEHYVMGFPLCHAISHHSIPETSLLLKFKANFQPDNLYSSLFTNQVLGDAPKKEAIKYAKWLLKQMNEQDKQNNLNYLSQKNPKFISYFT